MKHYNHLWVAAIIALLSFPAHAQGVPSCYGEATIGQNVTATNVSGALDLSTSGLIGGGGIGCDWKFGNIVVGPFARYEITSADGTLVGIKMQSSGLWTAGARVGYMINPSVMAYGFIGAAGSEFELASVLKDHSTGLAFGGGAEFALGMSNLSAKIEYQQTRFDDEKVFGPITMEPVSHVGRVGLVYRFSGSIFGQ